MKSSLAYLARYVLATSLLFSLWSLLGPLYLASITPAVNAVAAMAEMPFLLEWYQGHLLYEFRLPSGGGFRLEALDHGSVHLNLVTGVALLAATSGRSLGWHLRWGLTACVLLWCTHVFSFVIGGPVGLWQFSATSEAAAALAAPMSASLPALQATFFESVLELWGIWGRYGICLGVWLVASMQNEPVPTAARSSVFSIPVRWVMRSTTG